MMQINIKYNNGTRRRIMVCERVVLLTGIAQRELVAIMGYVRHRSV
jgi:hypothetical protein